MSPIASPIVSAGEKRVRAADIDLKFVGNDKSTVSPGNIVTHGEFRIFIFRITCEIITGLPGGMWGGIAWLQDGIHVPAFPLKSTIPKSDLQTSSKAVDMEAALEQYLLQGFLRTRMAIEGNS